MYRRGRNSGNGFFVLIMLLIFAPGLVGGIISGIMPLVVLGVVGATLFSVFKGIFSGAERKETARRNTRGKTVNKKRSTLSNADIVRIDSKLSEYFKHNYALAVIDDVSLVLSGGAYSSVDKLDVTYKDEKVVRLGEFKDSYPEMYDKILSLLNAFSKQSEEVLKSKPQANVRKEDVLSDADKYIEKINSLNAQIPQEEITNGLYQTCDLIKQIETSRDEKDNPKLKKLYDYYLPILVGILEKYKKLQDVSIKSDEFKDCESQLIKTIILINEALKTIYEEMHEDDYMNINADIETLQTLLKKDGLTEDPFKK